VSLPAFNLFFFIGRRGAAEEEAAGVEVAGAE